MRLPLRAIPVLFVAGAVGGLIGDAGHVQSGTTTYLDTGVPFIWESACWFVIAVGVATVAIGELRLRLAPVRPHRPSDLSDGLGAIAVVIGIYAVTALLYGEPLLPATVIVYGLAAIAWHVSGDGRPAAFCGVAAALVGTVLEIVLVKTDVIEYAASIDKLAGVPPWLPALYFAFGVVAARLGEISVQLSSGATE